MTPHYDNNEGCGAIFMLGALVLTCLGVWGLLHIIYSLMGLMR